MYIADGAHVKNYLNKNLFIFWFIVVIDQMVCFAMEYYYERKSEHIFTKFVSYTKDIECSEPWIFLGKNTQIGAKSKKIDVIPVVSSNI